MRNATYISLAFMCLATMSVGHAEEVCAETGEKRGIISRLRGKAACDAAANGGSVLSDRKALKKAQPRLVERKVQKPEFIEHIVVDTPVPITRAKINARLFEADAPPSEEASTLTLRNILLHTIENNPEIEIAYWQMEDSRYATRVAGAARLPQIEASAATGVEESRLESPPDAVTLDRSEASVRVSQHLYDFGKTGETIQRAKAIQQSRTLLYRDAIEETLFTAIVAYIDLLGADQLRQNAMSNVEAHERIVGLVEKSFRGGNVSEAELKRAQTRLDRAKTSQIDQEKRYERAATEFRRITGLEPGPVDAPNMDLSIASELTRATIDQFLMEHNQFQANIRDIASLQHQINAAKRAYMPSFSFQVVGAYKDNVLGNEQLTTDGRAMVSVTWNMFDGGASIARSGQMAARRNETEARLRKLKNELRQDAYNVITVLETSQEKRDIYSEQVVTSERVAELYAKQFEAGRRTLLDLLDAQSDLYAARSDDITNRYEMLAASFAALRFQNTLTETLVDQLELRTALTNPYDR